MPQLDYLILGAEIAKGQETFLVPSADKQTRSYDTYSNHHPSQSPLVTGINHLFKCICLGWAITCPRVSWKTGICLGMKRLSENTMVNTLVAVSFNIVQYIC